MAARTVNTKNKNLEIGELVKWYESYADGYITKDAGYGVVVGINTYELGFSEGPYTNYTAYRNKHSDTMRFGIEELELLIDE